MGFFDEMARGIIAYQMMPILAEFERLQHERMVEMMNYQPCYTTTTITLNPKRYTRRFHPRGRSLSKWLKTMQD